MSSSYSIRALSSASNGSRIKSSGKLYVSINCSIYSLSGSTTLIHDAEWSKVVSTMSLFVECLYAVSMVNDFFHIHLVSVGLSTFIMILDHNT